MMSKTTATSIETARNFFGTREFNEYEWHKLALPTTLKTAISYDAVKRIENTKRIYYTVAELVAELNACAGDDCYSCDWHYEVDSDGRAYQDITTVTYQMA